MHAASRADRIDLFRFNTPQMRLRITSAGLFLLFFALIPASLR